MNRKNFIINILLWILAFFFGYSIKKEGENLDITGKNGRSVSKKIDTLSETLEEVQRFPILPIEKDFVVRKDKPYGHVDRYGAGIIGLTDCSAAIQKAIDVIEEMGKGNSNEMPPIQFGANVYVIKKTIKVKCDITNSHENRPITFKGVPIRLVNSNPNKGTIIKPLISNYEGKSYANAFAINIKFNSDTKEDDSIVFGNKIINNISFENLTFLLDEGEINKFNINAIKCYRTRMKVKNVNFEGMSNGILEPVKDRLNNPSYCDFSLFEDINFKRIKSNGFVLCFPDNTSIKRVTNHYILPTASSYITIYGGAGITLENIHHAMHGDEGKSEFEPRNDATDRISNKALIKLSGTYGVSITGVYTERPLLDYVYYIKNVTNLSVKNYYERFMGNGFCHIVGKCTDITFENIYRHSNIINEYRDFYIRKDADISSLRVKNYNCRDWFNESITLDTKDLRNSVFTQANEKFRNIKTNLPNTFMANKVEGEELTLFLHFDGDSWRITDHNQHDVSRLIGIPSWDSDCLKFEQDSILCNFLIKSVSPNYIPTTSYLYFPVLNGGMNIIYLYDISGKKIQNPEDKISLIITLNTLINKKMLE